MNRQKQGHKPRQYIRKLFLIYCLVMLSACQSPHALFEKKALAWALTPQVVKTEFFSHKIYKNNRQSGTKLHIYLTGDGLPWMAGVIPSTDPTPRNSIIFNLIEQDLSTALILGRPCYHGLANETLCEPSLWTSKRYAPVIINSLSMAIEQLSEQYRATNLVLIGYSGGGALAVLLAEKIPNVSAVITIGANLNTQLWTQHHHLLALSGSINPVERPDLPVKVMQKHYVGSEDKIMPASLLKSYTEGHLASELVIIDDYNHQCCWQDIWPEILQQIQD
ncbi:MAG: hypothetical protein ACJA13_000317 [Paraglaciecola sp.]|jgi:hypothetical protein